MSPATPTMCPAGIVRGRLGRPNPYGKQTHGRSLYGIGHATNGEYQRLHALDGGVYTHKRQFYPYVITHKPGQDALRVKFRAAVAGWQSLTLEQRAVYNERVKRKNYSGYNLYIREYMLS